MPLELTREGLLVLLVSIYTTRGTQSWIVIYKAFCLEVTKGWMNQAPNEIWAHSCRYASLTSGSARIIFDSVI